MSPERRHPALRKRVTVVVTVIVAVTMTLAAATCFVAMRSSLRGETDRLLQQQTGFAKNVKAKDVQPKRLKAGLDALAKRKSSSSVYQVITADGRGLTPGNDPQLPITAADRATLRRPRGSTSLSDKTVKNYLSNVFQKLGVARRVQAAQLFDLQRLKRAGG